MRRLLLAGLMLLLVAPPGRAREPDGAAEWLARGTELAATDPGGAYEAFTNALRIADDQPTKNAVRDALLALATPPAPMLSDAERDIVVARIDEERSRYLRDVANRLLRNKQWRGARRILVTIKGSLEEEATAKVLGDPKAAERRAQELADLEIRIWQDMPAADKAAADAIMEEHRGDPPRRLREAGKLAKAKNLLGARRVLRDLIVDTSVPVDLRDTAKERVAVLEEAILDDLGDAERKVVDDALAHPAFGRLRTVQSREFIFIGDEDLVARIPERSRYVFDLAYLALTDLCGRVPNPDGDRVTVFFKELWDFGGAVGGGKIINVGRADPKSPRAVIVSSGLFFHELSHCVFDLHPGAPGWVEGIANFGAAFCGQFLKQDTPGDWGSAKPNLEAFQRDFLDRDLRWWRTAPYGPTAGWFLWWIDRHGRDPGFGLDWVRYARLFRGWRAVDPKPVTTTGIVRTFCTLLAREFGSGVWDDLEKQGFPGPGIEPPNLELPDGAAHEAWALRAEAREPYSPEEGVEARRRLGAIHGWRVAGPLYPEGDGLALVLRPEVEVRYDEEFPSTRQIGRWWTPGGDGPVQELPDGTLECSWAYPVGSVTYALAEVEVPSAVDAIAWVSTEHRWALWIGDRLVEKMGWQAGGNWIPERDRVPVQLPAGRHRVLLKAVLGHRGPTLALRLTDRKGRAIEGLVVHPAREGLVLPTAPATEAKRVFKDTFARGSLGRAWDDGPGSFRLRNKEARGEDDKGRVPWRKYSVRPGFPQDSPSNQLTLDPKLAARAGKDLRVTLHVAGNPKIALTLDAEDQDGGLTGWTVVVTGGGKQTSVRLEHYDRLVYLARDIPVGGGDEHVIVVERVGDRLSVQVDDTPALDRVHAPPLRPDGLRICTWGKNPALRGFELERLTPDK